MVTGPDAEGFAQGSVSLLESRSTGRDDQHLMSGHEVPPVRVTKAAVENGQGGEGYFGWGLMVLARGWQPLSVDTSVCPPFPNPDRFGQRSRLQHAALIAQCKNQVCLITHRAGRTYQYRVQSVAEQVVARVHPSKDLGGKLFLPGRPWTGKRQIAVGSAEGVGYTY